nr:Chain B, PPARgamma Coactivator-1a (PGC-1a) [Homo sapiens]
AALAALLAA